MMPATIADAASPPNVRFRPASRFVSAANIAHVFYVSTTSRGNKRPLLRPSIRMRLRNNIVILALGALTSACSGNTGTTTPEGTSSLDLSASVTLSTAQATQFEQIFVYAFPLPAGQHNLLGLRGTLSISSPMPVFNETLITVATMPGACPQSGVVYPSYSALYNVLPNLQPVQGFILKNPNQGTEDLAVNFRLPVGLPVFDCMVLLLDWEGQSQVTLTSALSMTYAAASSPSTAELLATGQESVWGANVGAGSTTNDSLQFVQENTIPQAGTILAFVGDISDSPFGVPAPPGPWQVRNDIYLVPGGCPSAIPVDSSGRTDSGGYYAADIPPTAQLLLGVPANGVGQMAVTQTVYQQVNIAVHAGDCLLTFFGLNAPSGGGIDAETQVQTLFQPAG